MSNSNSNVIILKSANIDEMKKSINKIKTSTEAITDEYNNLSGPNNCELYGTNLHSLHIEETNIYDRLNFLSKNYSSFVDELSKYETSEAKVIKDIKVPNLVGTVDRGTTTEDPKDPEPTPTPTPTPSPEPTPTPEPDPTPSPDPTPDPQAPPSDDGGTTVVHARQVGSGVHQVTISSPDNPEPETNEDIQIATDTAIDTDVILEDSLNPAPVEDIDNIIQEEMPPLDNIKDQIEIPLVEKTSVEPVKGKSNDGVILAGGLAAVGGLAFGAVQGINALEKKKEEEEEEKEKNKEGKFIVKNEGDN